MSSIRVLHGDFFECTKHWQPHCFDMVFADPPDNIGLEYDGYSDKMPIALYRCLLRNMVFRCQHLAPIAWVSFNARWTATMGHIIDQWIGPDYDYWPCVQTFTFGTNQKNWLTNGHRPLWCIFHKDAKFHPEQILVESWRQQHGDKRAKAGGRIPDDVFDFPRVTGNSKQRRPWHKTQLHEGLVERCVRFSTPEGGRVLDPFAGTGTTGRVCKRIGRECTLIEQSASYCLNIAAELGADVENFNLQRE